MVILVFLAFSISVFAQDYPIKQVVDILANPQENLSPEGYTIQCIDGITNQEWNEVIKNARDCTEGNIKNCFHFCSTIQGTKFDISWSELQQKLDSVSLPGSQDLCKYSKPSLRMTSVWLEKKCPLHQMSSFKASDLDSFSSSLKNNPQYRMKDPKGLCRERAFLLAENLVAQGYNPKLTFIGTDNQGSGIKLQFNGVNYDYDHHWVVLLTDNLGGQQVLDPQFFDKNIDIENYIKIVSPPDPVKTRTSNYHYLVKYLEPDDIDKSCEQLKDEIYSQTISKILEK